MHVRAAKALMEAGVSVREGTRIGYVVVDGGGPEIKVVPEQHYTGEYDRHYLWENLVYPPTERLLAVCFPGEKWGGYGRTRRHDSQAQGRLF
jgi:DNA polymerase elongation subunit (family B)